MKYKIFVTVVSILCLLNFSGTAPAMGPGHELPTPDYDFRTQSSEKVELGRVLMFDKILSGNMNISCGTCHHSLTGTGDGLSLPVGEGGKGLGVTRDVNAGTPDEIVERVPRNAPPVFNLGDNSFHTLFHDGRVTTIVQDPCLTRSAGHSGKCAGLPGDVPGHFWDRNGRPGG